MGLLSHLLAAIHIDGNLGVLNQVLSVFATMPNHHKLQIWVPFQNIV